jgi:hypothetical protein
VKKDRTLKGYESEGCILITTFKAYSDCEKKERKKERKEKRRTVMAVKTWLSWDWSPSMNRFKTLDNISRGKT